MAENTAIEWADHTFNPWEGCQKVGPGCDNCYAEARNARFGGGVAPNWGPGAPRRRTSAATWQKPLQWNRNAEAFHAAHGRRQRVFCASLADVFDNQVPEQWRVDLFRLIQATPHLDWLLLTKRIGNAQRMIEQALIQLGDGATDTLGSWPWPHVWLGTTVVTQQEAERDVPKLQDTPAAVRFLSIEPMLGPITLGPGGTDKFGHLARRGQGSWYETKDGLISDAWTYADYPLEGKRSTKQGQYSVPRIDWVICGGESGPGARPMHPDWARSLRDQCAAAGVPFLFKQHGEWLPHDKSDPRLPDLISSHGTDRCVSWPGGSVSVRVCKKAAGRLLDGVEHNGFPQTSEA